DRRTEPQELVVVGRVADDRVRVADRDGHHLVLLSVDVDLLLLPPLDRAHPPPDLLAVAHRGHDLARPDLDPDAIVTVSARQPAGGDPRPVSRDVRGGAGAIPDDDLRRVAVRGQHFDDAVRTDAEVVVADLLH